MMNVENELLLDRDEEGSTGQFEFSAGHVTYQIEKLTEELIKVTFDLRMEGLPVVSGIGYYDNEARKMIKWIEKN